MFDNTTLARIGALVGDPGRASMLAALLDGRALTAAELAAHAGVTPQTASGHLAKLVATGLVVMRRQGRHRYHSLASPEVAAHAREHEPAGGVAGRHRSGRPSASGRATPRCARRAPATTIWPAASPSAWPRPWPRRGHVVIDRDGGLVTPEGARFLQDFGIDIGAARNRGARSAAPAWTGASAACTSRARWARRSCAAASSCTGSAGSRARARSP